LLLLTGCQQTGNRVDAADYDSFWLWAGVKPQPVLNTAKTIYILEAEIRGEKAQLISLRAATPKIKHAAVWLVYRVETLDWGPDIVPHILSDLTRWRAAGNTVSGVQIDFDSATKGLPRYADFLGALRKRLPANCKLGATGLLDWSSNGDSRALNALGDVIDEVVLQTYQGRNTINGYREYLAGLDRMEIPYKVGLVQNGEWQAPASLAKDPNFKGYVIFLLNPTKKPDPG
jgi:Protein of unknown function (DUF3142)